MAIWTTIGANIGAAAAKLLEPAAEIIKEKIVDKDLANELIKDLEIAYTKFATQLLKTDADVVKTLSNNDTKALNSKWGWVRPYVTVLFSTALVYACMYILHSSNPNIAINTAALSELLANVPMEVWFGILGPGLLYMYLRSKDKESDQRTQQILGGK